MFDYILIKNADMEIVEFIIQQKYFKTAEMNDLHATWIFQFQY